MKKHLKGIASGIKYAVYLGLGTVGAGFCYLQYINTQVGPISVNREETTKFYINNYKMDSNEASRMYYWMLYDIGLMRVFTYHSYLSYSQKLNKKIVDPIISNYKQANILEKIEASQNKADSQDLKNLFKEVQEVRKKNFQNLTNYQYVIKQMRKMQKLMDTRKIVGLEQETLSKIDKIHAFICETGTVLKKEEILAYLKDLPILEERIPGDILHKILFI